MGFLKRKGGKAQALRWLGLVFPSAFVLWTRLERRFTSMRSRGARPAPAQGSAAPGPQGSSDLRSALVELGVRRGDTVLVHSSWAEASRLCASPAALVELFEDLVGVEGTLCMPAYPVPGWRTKGLFDIRRTPSGAGLLSEVFRRAKGVRRSYQLNSVAARGPKAEELLGEHHLFPHAAGEHSPYAKLSRHQGKVVCLGVGPETNTLFHCAEDILRETFPVKVYGREPTVFSVLTETGESVQVPVWYREERFTYCCDPTRLLPYFSEIVTHRAPQGVALYLVPAAEFLERLLHLARQGIHMYGFRFPPRDRVLGPAMKRLEATPGVGDLPERRAGLR